MVRKKKKIIKKKCLKADHGTFTDVRDYSVLG